MQCATSFSKHVSTLLKSTSWNKIQRKWHKRQDTILNTYKNMPPFPNHDNDEAKKGGRKIMEMKRK